MIDSKCCGKGERKDKHFGLSYTKFNFDAQINLKPLPVKVNYIVLCISFIYKFLSALCCSVSTIISIISTIYVNAQVRSAAGKTESFYVKVVMHKG